MSEVLQTLVDLVSFRIAAEGIKPIKTEEGVIKYVSANIFEKKDIEKALDLSLTAFNALPPFTYFKCTDEENIMQISDILVTYASFLLLTRQSLLEKGREIILDDNGVKLEPPQLANFVYTTARDLFSDWKFAVIELKNSASFYEDFIKEPDSPIPGEKQYE